jgi:orotate phosphoribosyltransferase
MLEMIGLILGVLGLFGMSQLLKFFDRTVGRWWLLKTWDQKRVEFETKRLVSRSIVEFEKSQNVATFGQPLNVTYYIDLMTTVTTRDEKLLLDRCLLRWIRLHYDTIPDKIAVPKLGNVILAESVASRLGVPLIIVRQDTHLFIRGGHSLEGKLSPGEKVLLIDDVASEAEFLVRCLNQLRKFQATLVGSLCVVNRTEGDAKSVHKKIGVPFTYILELNDNELRAMIRPSSSATPNS